MRGHITQRTKETKDSYTIVMELDKDPITGKRRQQWVTIRGTKRDAEKHLVELLHQLDRGTYTPPNKTTLAEYLTRWLEEYAKANLSPRGYERYESVSRVHLTPSLGNIPLTQLRADHIQKLYNDKLNSGLSARTVRYHHVVLHKALQTAIKWGLVSRNVTDGVDAPRAQRTEMRTWNESELNLFLEAALEIYRF